MILSNFPPFISDAAISKELLRNGRLDSPIKRTPLGCKSTWLNTFQAVFMVLKEDIEELNLVLKFRVEEL